MDAKLSKEDSNPRPDRSRPPWSSLRLS